MKNKRSFCDASVTLQIEKYAPLSFIAFCNPRGVPEEIANQMSPLCLHLYIYFVFVMLHFLINIL